MRCNVADLFNSAQQPSQEQDLFSWDSIALSLAAIPPRRHSSQISVALAGGASDSASSQADLQGLLRESHSGSEDSSRNAEGVLAALAGDDLQTLGLEQSECQVSGLFQDHPSTTGFVDTHYTRDEVGVASQASTQASEPPQSSDNWIYEPYNTLSPSSVEHAMMFRTDNSFISQNLLRVYHDVFEHNLSCWVSGESCPYKMPVRRRSGSPATALSYQHVSQVGGSGLIQEEWGAAWSNRIYSRVINLDRVAQSSNIIQLTRAEDQSVMKAFHLAIMAFSSQWAHQSRREREKYSSNSVSESHIFSSSDDLAEEFDRLIQRSFWEQARNALDDCAELECYRVVCAELIFGLAQKPWDRDMDYPVSDMNGSIPMMFEHGVGGMNTSIMAQIQSIISKDGPPVFIERAARKAHALKFRLEAFDAGLMKANKDRDYPYEPDPTTVISAGDRETAGFVYWLAVMFDTISASMYQRPVVVADEDSQHDAADEEALSEHDGFESSATIYTRRWSINHFIQDNLNWPRQPLRWPCSYEDAARTVTRSGPVKILLYRHVSYLQDAIRRRQRGESIEYIIRNAVLVYCYWNVTYGVFFRDLIDNYDAVPPRIQSWFFCIHAHWHLAALILADLVESVDYNELGDQQAKQDRLSSATVNTIRRASAGELADLARITTPSDWTERMNPPLPQLPDFHSAVNQGAILTEPWTMILIRAFSKAFVWHFDEAELWQLNRASLGHGRQDHKESVGQCEDCVRALWYLGRKSDMARNVAMALSKALAAFEAQNA